MFHHVPSFWDIMCYLTVSVELGSITSAELGGIRRRKKKPSLASLAHLFELSETKQSDTMSSQLWTQWCCMSHWPVNLRHIVVNIKYCTSVKPVKSQSPRTHNKQCLLTVKLFFPDSMRHRLCYFTKTMQHTYLLHFGLLQYKYNNRTIWILIFSTCHLNISVLVCL